ncbi:hypothetical protein [Xanthomonas oryzae]|nr:hypothetical protein [Xanthomonas oryzae]UNE63809.1 hypothetical protein MML47_06325 [Xanthomonas oryzae]
MTVRGSQMDAYCGRIAGASPMRRDRIAGSCTIRLANAGSDPHNRPGTLV